MLYSTLFTLALLGYTAAEDCPCGWKLEETGDVYTHRIFNDFSKMSDIKNLLTDKNADPMLQDWMLYDFWLNSDNPSIRLNTKFDAQNIMVQGGELHMLQKGYSDLDMARFGPVSIAGLQTRATDILHGTFRVVMKLEGANGGSCASFFWYHNDAQELDIEAVTPGTSIVNNTINYTTQPSVRADWSRIPNATQSMPLEHTLDTFRTHRFDCDSAKGVSYYLDEKVVHIDTHNTPTEGGSLQLKLWADGNKWWSGLPSKTDVHLRAKSIIAYFNTTSSFTDQEWHNRCAREKKQCKAITTIEQGKKDQPRICDINPHHPHCPNSLDHNVILPDDEVNLTNAPTRPSQTSIVATGIATANFQKLMNGFSSLTGLMLFGMAAVMLLY